MIPRRGFRRRPGVGDPERGSISILVVSAAIALLLVVALVIDGGRKVQAVAQATSIAQEAARAAAQALDPTALAQGRTVSVDPAAARTEAEAYLSAAHAQGDVTTTATTVEVHVTVSRPTVFLAAAGITSVTGTGTGTAELVTTGGAAP